MTFSWLQAVENPLVKPFYKQFMPHARVNRSETVAVLRQENIIVACARLRPIGEFELLTGMLVHPDLRGQQLGHRLLSGMRERFTEGRSFTFALSHLTKFYAQHGFVSATKAPDEIHQRFLAYQAQGRDIVLMAYTPKQRQGASFSES